MIDLDKCGRWAVVAGGSEGVGEDNAVALCESFVLLRRPQPLPDSRFPHQAWQASAQEYLVWREAANHFELQRREEGWRITKRTSRMLDGRPAGHRLPIAGATGAPLGAEADERGA